MTLPWGHAQNAGPQEQHPHSVVDEKDLTIKYKELKSHLQPHPMVRGLSRPRPSGAQWSPDERERETERGGSSQKASSSVHVLPDTIRLPSLSTVMARPDGTIPRGRLAGLLGGLAYPVSGLGRFALAARILAK